MRGRRKLWAAGFFVALLLTAAVFGGCGDSSSTAGETTSKDAKGDSRSADAPNMVEDGMYISTADCMALKQFLSAELKQPVQATPRLEPLRFTECSLRSSAGLVVVYIDATNPVRKRYLRRVDGIREGTTDRKTRLRPVPGLGEGLEGESGAYWLPSFSSLYSYDKRGWMTLLYTLEKLSDAQKRVGATALARRAFELTAEAD